MFPKVLLYFYGVDTAALVTQQKCVNSLTLTCFHRRNRRVIQYRTTQSNLVQLSYVSVISIGRPILNVSSEKQEKLKRICQKLIISLIETYPEVGHCVFMNTNKPYKSS